MLEASPVYRLMNAAKMAFTDLVGFESIQDQFKNKTDAKIAADRAMSFIPDMPGIKQLAEYGTEVENNIRNSISKEGKNH